MKEEKFPHTRKHSHRQDQSGASEPQKGEPVLSREPLDIHPSAANPPLGSISVMPGLGMLLKQIFTQLSDATDGIFCMTNTTE